MSIARAFTTRRMKQSSTDMGILPHRSSTTKGHAQSGSIRNKISSPMELTHTTNMLAYNAPDLYPRTTSSPASSSKSDDESSLSSPSTTMSSPPTSPEIPSVGHISESPEPNHLSCYFTAPTQKPSIPNIREAPTIPKRAPSHTKKASFDNLANKHARFSNQSSNTVSTKASSMMSRSSSTSTSVTSVSSVSHTQKPSMQISTTSSITPIPLSPTPRFRRPNDVTNSQHPFGQELAKVSELAEELGVKDKLQDTKDEEEQLIAKGLYKFKAEDYLAEIHELLSTFIIPESVPSQQTVWI
ncbi:hypothetical protein E0Z10_g8037 [Xylaria hypoxylon]|uniref:Uncharacterized protein n=1 Tax=Xylaria hypoxylon TaxID=37992 RepID=A0A4Z0YTC3_9PEZI|nr:hypothetical protein E0Z10_g8037 [Xylaria hypoxylon]